MNIHIHPVNLDIASRVLKALASAGRSGCFSSRTFLGAGPEREYQFQDAAGPVQVKLFPRLSRPHSGFLRKLLATSAWTRQVKMHARKLPATCINVHGLSTLSLGVALKRHHHCKLIYDTHELETRVAATRGLRRLFSERLERVLIKQCDAVVCVSDGIADWYASQYGIERPLVVRNVPDHRFQLSSHAGVKLRTHFNIPAGALLFLYQGRLSPGRQIEKLLDAFLRVSSTHHLLFLGKGELSGMIGELSSKHRQVHLHPPVSPQELLGYTAQADIGLVGMEDSCLNHRLSLPNKLFEYLSVGIPPIIPDLPEMRRLVERYQCGWSWPGTTDGLEQLLRRLSPNEVEEKRRNAVTAGQELSWEKEEQALLRLYRGLVRPPEPAHR